jgi:acyl-CoA thioester hydrolase
MQHYSKTYEIRWADLDANGHVNYAAYIDATADVRYRFFTERRLPPERFSEMGIGPVYTAIEARFLREVLFGETVTITYTLAGLSPSGMRWRVHHDVLKANGKKAVSIQLEGTILNLTSRRAVPATPEVLEVFGQSPHDMDFQHLTDVRRAG